ncbi:MAG: AcrR family transcriptional regulator [Flavobacteriales bacterium]|jgi:AcrR family transcriptional regulator
MPAGRKREFDKKQALRTAMLVFWEKGYSGTALSELCAQMGINKPSLYSTFGNKEALHAQAIDFYFDHYGQTHLNQLNSLSLSVRECLSNFLTSIADMQFNCDLPKGCFVSLCASERVGDCLSDTTIKKIESLQEITETRLIDFFEQRKGCGELSEKFNTKQHCLLLGLLIHGSAVFARSGADVGEVKQSFTLALQGMNLNPLL